MNIQRVRLWCDYISGITSGFPDCCVLFYLSLSVTTFTVAGAVDDRRGPDGVGYVRCPYCYAHGIVVEIRHNTWWDKFLCCVYFPIKEMMGVIAAPSMLAEIRRLLRIRREARENRLMLETVPREGVEISSRREIP